MLRKALLVLVLSLPLQAQAALPELADRLPVEQPMGCGTFDFLMQEIYRIKLWAPAYPLDENQPFALSITYNVDFARVDIAEKSIELMAKLDGQDFKTMEGRYRVQLEGALRDVKRGDRITALFNPPAETLFFYKGAESGMIQDREFMRLFSGIWLSPKTEAPDLRQQLIGNHGCAY